MPRNPLNSKSRLRGLLIALILSGMLVLASGCSTVSLGDQVRLARPGMQFTDSPALADAASVLSTVEPGTDDRGGAAASGCTACR
jgi:hypothetical protein